MTIDRPLAVDKATWLAPRSLVGRRLFDGDISWPALVLQEDALAHNIDTLARFCRQHGLAFAPHGKTTMAPALFQRQIDAGAWGITVATAQQAEVARQHGVARVLLAHELLDRAALKHFAAELAADPSFEFTFFVDSSAGVQAAAEAGRLHPSRGGMPVILDIGYPGGRTGLRTVAAARELAREIAAAEGVHLIGVGGYEGGLATPTLVRGFFGTMRAVVEELAADGLLPAGPVVTAGGSTYFDLVAEELGGDWSMRLGATIVLRSGAYLIHDDGIYRQKTPFLRVPGEGTLRPALHLWAQVVSAPEPGLALAAMGKRDAPYDAGMPMPLAVRRATDGGSLSAAATVSDTEPVGGRLTVAEPIDAHVTVAEPISGRATVPAMDDQHCYLTLTDGFELRPGDLVQFGISHPCTAVDKWREILVVDNDDRIVEVVPTYF